VGQSFDTVLNIVYELFIKEGTILQRFLTYLLLGLESFLRS